MSPPAERALLSPAEVAALFGVGVTTLARWRKAGKLPGMRTPGGSWRYDAAQVARLVESQITERTEG